MELFLLVLLGILGVFEAIWEYFFGILVGILGYLGCFWGVFDGTLEYFGIICWGHSFSQKGVTKKMTIADKFLRCQTNEYTNTVRREI